MFIVVFSDVLHRPLILIISSCCFAEEGTCRNVPTRKLHVQSVLLFLLIKPINCFVAFSLPLPSSLLS